MYIAAKLEEIFPQELGEFAYITDNTYNKQQVTATSKLSFPFVDCISSPPHKDTPCLRPPFQIIRMERLILQTLDFNLVAPTPYTFLLRYLKAAEAEQLQTLGDDPVELTGQTIESLAKVGSHLLLIGFLGYFEAFLVVFYCLLFRHACDMQ